MALVSNILSMKMTEAQANDMKFLLGVLNNLTNFIIVLQCYYAKAEGPMMLKWDEAMQRELVKKKQIEMFNSVQVMESKKLLVLEQLRSKKKFQGFLSLSLSC